MMQQHASRELYRLTLGLSILVLAYILMWLGIAVSFYGGWLTGKVFGMDLAAAFGTAGTGMTVFSLVVSISISAGVVAGVFQRRRWALYLEILAVIVATILGFTGRWQWPEYDLWTNDLVFAIGLVLLALIGLMTARGELR